MTEIKKRLDFLIENALKNNVFSGCSVGYFHLSGQRATRNLFYYGTTGRKDSSLPIDQSSVFDLASMTKPLVTSLSVQALVDDKKLCLNDTLDRFFTGRSVEGEKGSITIRQLLNHTAGFPAHKPYYLDLMRLQPEDREKTLTDWILREHLLSRPGAGVLYSDLGYILLGVIIKKIAHTNLASYWTKKVVEATQLQNDLFFASQLSTDKIPFVVTGKCSWSQNTLSGLVNDDNCRIIGGVAGHAGLFGTAQAVLEFCEILVKMYHDCYQHPCILNESLRKNIDEDEGSRRFGFDTPTGEISSSGRFYSKKSIGHLGFTGTSFWLDLKTKAGIIFLTNRVYCGNDLSGIKELRPLVHDVIMKHIAIPPAHKGESQ